MSAKEELIAAALRLAALAERNTDDRNEWQHAIDSVREGCARAMVQPDMVEVERLIDAFGSSCDSVKKFGHITSFKPIGQQITERREARAALLAHICGEPLGTATRDLGWMKDGRETAVHYKDGRVEWYNADNTRVSE